MAPLAPPASPAPEGPLKFVTENIHFKIGHFSQALLVRSARNLSFSRLIFFIRQTRFMLKASGFSF